MAGKELMCLQSSKMVQGIGRKIISLTSVVCKLVGRFIKEAIMNHVTNNKLLLTKHCGFISGRSTTTQLLRYLDERMENIVDAIYIDFAKAFDTVQYRRLLGKLVLWYQGEYTELD